MLEINSGNQTFAPIINHDLSQLQQGLINLNVTALNELKVLDFLDDTHLNHVACIGYFEGLAECAYTLLKYGATVSAINSNPMHEPTIEDIRRLQDTYSGYLTNFNNLNQVYNQDMIMLSLADSLTGTRENIVSYLEHLSSTGILVAVLTEATYLNFKRYNFVNEGYGMIKFKIPENNYVMALRKLPNS